MAAETGRTFIHTAKAWLRRHHPWPFWAFLLILAVLVFLARSAHGI
jgi:hypothetical protein